MFRHLESMLMCSRKSFSHFFRLIFAILKCKIGVVASFLKTETDPNQTIKQAYVKDLCLALG